MKLNIKKYIPSLVMIGLCLTAQAKAASITLRLDVIGDVTQSAGPALTGKAWFGNLQGYNPAGGVGQPWTVADIAANFRSAYEFDFTSSLVSNGGASFTVGIGTAPQPATLDPDDWPVINPTASGQFAGQGLLLLVSNRNSFTDLSAGTEWIVFESAANFGTANDINSVNTFVELSNAGGAILTLSASPGFWLGSVSGDGTVKAQAVTGITSAVPEPSSASLMLLGAAGVLALRRLRKNNV
jgi:hypothetical protein